MKADCGPHGNPPGLSIPAQVSGPAPWNDIGNMRVPAGPVLAALTERVPMWPSSASAFPDFPRRTCPRPGGSRQCWGSTAWERCLRPIGIRIFKIGWMSHRELARGRTPKRNTRVRGAWRPRPRSHKSADRASISAPVADPRLPQTAMGEAGSRRTTAPPSLPVAHRFALHAPAVRYDSSSHGSMRAPACGRTGN